MIEKKIVRSYQGYNSKLYNSKADLGEKNSGEVRVDITGYIPLQDLLVRCGITEQQIRNAKSNFDVVPGLDKFNDRFDIAQDNAKFAEELVVQDFLKKKKNSVNSQQPQTFEVKNDGTIEKK